MPHRNKKSFSAKHPLGTKVADNIRNALKPSIIDGQITCADAHHLALEINVPPQQLGIAIDLCEARISACQLGLFGASEQAPSDPPMAIFPESLEQAIQAASNDNTIVCSQAWQIGHIHGVPRQQVGQACNDMGVKISRCQLGAF